MAASLGQLPIQDETVGLRQQMARRHGSWVGRMLQLNFTHTWGDKWYLGLAGLEVLGTGERVTRGRWRMGSDLILKYFAQSSYFFFPFNFYLALLKFPCIIRMKSKNCLSLSKLPLIPFFLLVRRPATFSIDSIPAGCRAA